MLYTPHCRRNRAINGDMVAIRLLPRTQWQPLTKALPSSSAQQHPAAEGEEGMSVGDTRPSGAVVGILSRPDRLYVASFGVSAIVYLSASAAASSPGLPLIIL